MIYIFNIKVIFNFKSNTQLFIILLRNLITKNIIKLLKLYIYKYIKCTYFVIVKRTSIK
jgi:hypothetical protein